MPVTRLSVVQFVRPLPSCSPRTNRRPDHLDPAEPMHSNSRPTPDAQSPTHFTEVFSFAPIVYCVDRVTKPERRARYFPTRQDAARLWLECGGTDLCRDQGSDRHLRAKSGAGRHHRTHVQVVDDDLMKNS